MREIKVTPRRIGGEVQASLRGGLRLTINPSPFLLYLLNSGRRPYTSLAVISAKTLKFHPIFFEMKNLYT